MSKVNDVLQEACDRLEATPGGVFQKKVVLAWTVEDLLDHLKGIKSPPAIGVIYEGMTAQPDTPPSTKVGVSSLLVVTFVLVEHGDSPVHNDVMKKRPIDYLDMMRDQFMGTKSTVTQHFWQFLVESPAEVKSGEAWWTQRWAVPIQLPPRQ